MTPILIWVLTLCLTLDGKLAYIYIEKDESLSDLRECGVPSAKKNIFNMTLVVTGNLHTNVTLIKRKRDEPMTDFFVKVKHEDGNEELTLQSPSSCHYAGFLPDHQRSWVHLSTCQQRFSGIIFDGVNLLSLESTSQKSKQLDSEYTIRRIKYDGPSKAGCFPVYPNTTSSKGTLKRKSRRHKRFSVEERKVIELYVVIDSNMFSDTGINKNKTLAVHYVESMVQYLNKIFQAIRIQVFLVGVEIWTTDPVPLPTDATQLLNTFLNYSDKHIANTMNMDFQLLLSGLTFQNFIVGMAHVGVMCGRQSGAVIHYERFGHVKTAVTSAHEIGHVLGLLHDDNSCNCSDKIRKCIMEPDISKVPFLFSSCSRDTLKSVLSNGGATCLYDLPDVVYHGPVCGNGIRERNEICDCGSKMECQNSTCCSFGCKLKPGAECDNGGCCKACKKQVACTLCRSSQNDCDLEEFCDGTSEECPSNLYKRDFTSCGKSGAVGFCYHGKCRSNKAQCQYLWGSGAHPSDPFCFNANKVGTTTGNCGTRTKHPNVTFHKCKQRDIMCGMINCDSSHQYPVIGGRQKVVINKYTLPDSSVKTCRAAIIDLGDDVPDPGLVDDGSPCSYGNISGVCLNQQCKTLSDVPHKLCPNGSNGLECSGKGICNNHGDCWCRYGHSGPDCASTYNPCIRETPKHDDKFPKWAIGVATGVPVVIIIIVCLILFKVKRLFCWKNTPRLTKVEDLT